MKLIVGLGNPGAEYEGTRHNVGFEVIRRLSRRHAIPLSKRDFRASFGSGAIAGCPTLLVCPMTYMNLSGESVGSIARFYKIPTEDVLLILDDVALPTGRLRLRAKGSAGGHNGLENVIQHLHTTEVARIRIGVGAARPGNLVGHVLARFRADESDVMAEAYDLAADAVECALTDGFDMAMNRFNTSEKQRTSPETTD